MSVEKRGRKYRVRFRDASGSNRARTFDRKADADAFDLELRRARQMGPELAQRLLLRPATLREFVDGGFRAHAVGLTPDTRRHYRWALENHLGELLDEPLTALGVPRLRWHQQYLLDHGRTPSTVRQAMTRLSGILTVAVEDGEIPANPVLSLRKVPADLRPDVNPLTPVELERLIASLDGRGRAVTLLGGHLGLRPIEIRQVPWSRFDRSGEVATLTVSRDATKRGAARTRVIDVPAVTARELRDWQLASGGRGDDPIIPDDDGHPLGKAGLRLWAYKRLDPAARKATGREDVTLYTLRHTHASLLHYAGFTAPEAAARMGHGLPVHWSRYAHIVNGQHGKRYDGLDALIAAARAEVGTQARLVYPLSTQS